MLRSPIVWFGGKGNLVRRLLKFVPEHDAYLEPFFGAGSLFFAKEVAKIEVINDIDHDLMNFYAVLRDEEKFARFYRLAYLTPYSRGEYNEALRKFRNKAWKDDVERAHLFFVIVRMSFGARFAASWGYNITAVEGEMSQVVRNYLSAIDRLPEIHERLRRVQVECDDWLSVWHRYVPVWKEKGFKTFVYLDPPYMPETRRNGTYRFEFTEKQHEELIEVIKKERGVKIMLSGYPSQLYEELERFGWHKICWNVACHAVGRTRHTGIQGEGATFKKGQRRIDCIWMNYHKIRQTNLSQFQ